jgi:hypothetical protein
MLTGELQSGAAACFLPGIFRNKTDNYDFPCPKTPVFYHIFSRYEIN